jgi:nucleoside-diphosphate-sugar epimerase
MRSVRLATYIRISLIAVPAWGVVKYEDIDLDALNEGGAYTLSKGLAEKKVWEIADKHPDVDVTTCKYTGCFQEWAPQFTHEFSVLPPLIFGPFPPNVRIPKGFGISNAVLYQILTGGSDGPRTYPDFPVKQCVDVRDCAKTHLLALEAPPLPNGERKRLLTIAGDFNWEEATLFLREKRPELTSRLPSDEAIKKGAQTPLSFKFVQVNTEKALGLKQSEYKTWRQTFLDTIDMFTEYERASVSA